MTKKDPHEQLSEWIDNMTKIVTAQGKAIEILAYAAPYHTQMALAEAYAELENSPPPDSGDVVSILDRIKRRQT